MGSAKDVCRIPNWSLNRSQGGSGSKGPSSVRRSSEIYEAAFENQAMFWFLFFVVLVIFFNTQI